MEIEDSDEVIVIPWPGKEDAFYSNLCMPVPKTDLCLVAIPGALYCTSRESSSRVHIFCYLLVRWAFFLLQREWPCNRSSTYKGHRLSYKSRKDESRNYLSILYMNLKIGSILPSGWIFRCESLTLLCPYFSLTLSVFSSFHPFFYLCLSFLPTNSFLQRSFLPGSSYSSGGGNTISSFSSRPNSLTQSRFPDWFQ